MTELRSSDTDFHPCSAGAAAAQAPAARCLANHPDDVLHDGSLSPAEKRALLASWVSDARAVKDAPALRQLDSGAVVDVDEILRALKSLDASEARTVGALAPAAILRPFDRRRRRWCFSAPGYRRHATDGDDPPPRPAAAAAIPVPPSFLDASSKGLRTARAG